MTSHADLPEHIKLRMERHAASLEAARQAQKKRLANALRDNLKRRKDQARARKAEDKTDQAP